MTGLESLVLDDEDVALDEDAFEAVAAAFLRAGMMEVRPVKLTEVQQELSPVWKSVKKFFSAGSAAPKTPERREQLRYMYFRTHAIPHRNSQKTQEIVYLR